MVFFVACLVGHKRLAELMIVKGADHWNDGLAAACQGGHKELVELMIAKGTSRCFFGKSIIDH